MEAISKNSSTTPQVAPLPLALPYWANSCHHSCLGWHKHHQHHPPFYRGSEKNPAPWRQQVLRDKELEGHEQPTHQLGRGKAFTLSLVGEVLGSCQKSLAPTLTA